MGIRAIPRNPNYDTTTHKHRKKSSLLKNLFLATKNQIKIVIRTAEWRNVVTRNSTTCLMPHGVSVIAGKKSRPLSLHTWGIKVDSFTCSWMMGDSPSLKTRGLSVTEYSHKSTPQLLKWLASLGSCHSLPVSKYKDFKEYWIERTCVRGESMAEREYAN